MASDTRIYFISSLLLLVTITSQVIESTYMKVSLNWNEPRKQTSHALFMSIDPNLVVDNKTKGFNEGFDAINAMSMAAELSPAFLVMGGPTTDRSCLNFDPSVFSEMSTPKEENNRSACCYERPRQMVITGEQLLILSSFAEEAGLKIVITLGYDYNLHHKRLRLEKADDCLAWDESEVTKLTHFANMMNISINYQLGYEIRYDYKCEKDKNCIEERETLQKEAEQSGAAYGSDINHLRELLDKHPASRMSLILPSGIHIQENTQNNVELSSQSSYALSNHLHSTYAQAYLDKCSKNLDAVVLHTSTFKDESGQKFTQYNSTIFNQEMSNTQQILQQSAVDKPLWIGETYRDESSIMPASANEAFNVALNWVEHLGTACQTDASVILHSLKSVGENSPDPKYWVSLLHKHLAGSVVAKTNVMSANNTEGRKLFFAHCTPFSNSEKYRKPYIESFPKGSVTVYAANPFSDPKKVYLQVDKPGRDDESMENAVHEFVLKPEEKDGQYTGQAELNGNVLRMGDNGAMPHFHAKLRTDGIPRKTRSANLRITRKSRAKLGRAKLSERKTHRSERNAEHQIELFMPPYSIVFWVLPRGIIGETPCLEKEEDTEKKVQRFFSFTHRPSDENLTEDHKKKPNGEDKPREKRQIQRTTLAEISKRRVQARKIRPFANTRMKTPIKTLDKGKRALELEPTDLDFKPRRKRKSRNHGRDQGPKTVSFDIDDGEDEPELVEDGYEKGMLTLSEVIALSSKESGKSDDDYSDEKGVSKIKPGVLKGVWNLGKKLSDKMPTRRVYKGPSSHIMGLGGKAIAKTSVTNGPRRELFEADIQEWEDESKMDSKEEENDEPSEDENYEHSEEYEVINEDEIVGNDPRLVKGTAKDNGLKIVSMEDMDSDDNSNVSDEFDEEELAYGEHRKTTSKKGNGRNVKASKSEDEHYFQRYKRDTEENSVANVGNDIWDTNQASGEKYGYRRFTRNVPLVAEEKKIRTERVKMEDDVIKRISSSVFPAKGASGSSKEFPNVKNPSIGYLKRANNPMNDFFSNGISESFESKDKISTSKKNTYSVNEGKLSSDENNLMLTEEETDDVKHLGRQIRRQSRVLPIDRRFNSQVSNVPSRGSANRDVISRQLTSPQIEADNIANTTTAEENVANTSSGGVGNSSQPYRPNTDANTANETSGIPPVLGTPPRNRSDASRAEQRRISMELIRRRTAEERRKAMSEYRQMLEERRKRRLNPGQDQAISVFREGMERTIGGVIGAQERSKREIHRPQDDKRTERLMSDKVRKKRQSLMYNDSEGADHHRVIRKTREIRNWRKGKPAAATADSMQETRGKNPSFEEDWPVDKKFGNIAKDSHVSGELSTYSHEKWRDVLRSGPRKSNYFSIDTDEVYKPGLYEVINNMLESVPLSNIDLNLINANKSPGKGENNLEVKGGQEEENQDELGKVRSSLSKNSRSDDVRKGLRERIQKAKEERRKALEKISRETRSVDYDLFDDDSLLTNKIAKHKKSMSDKAKMLFYVLDENQGEPKTENAVELHMQKIFEVERLTPDLKADFRNISDNRSTVSTKKVDKKKAEKGDKMKELTDRLQFKDIDTNKKNETINAVLPNKKAKISVVQKETPVYRSDDSFFSHILQQLFTFMDSLHSVMSSPIG